jgi:hypothetical protein
METKHILHNTLENSLVDPEARKELLIWYDIITKQNYFSHNNQILMQKDRLTSSSILSKIFLQKLEHTHIPLLTEKHKLINYFRYIDIIIFDTNHTNTQSILNIFNTIHPNIKFIAKLERNNTTMHKTHDSIKVSIYRKPTFTDTIIPYMSNPSSQHKYSAISF